VRKDTKVSYAYASYFKDSGVQWGAKWSSSFLSNAFKNQAYNLYFNHQAGANTVGAQINYDHNAKQWSSILGLQLNQDDHTWKARIHDSGIMRLALQWNLHRVAKTTLDTSIDLRSFPQ
jgi:hypothetical protein